MSTLKSAATRKINRSERIQRNALPHEASFAEAQKWWTPMRQAVTFPGVPGHPFQPSVLWNAGVQFWPLPRNFTDHAKHEGARALMQELDGHEADALHLEFSFGAGFDMPDRLNSDQGLIRQQLDDGRRPIIMSQLQRGSVRWTQTVFCRLACGGVAERGDEVLLTEVRWTAHNPTGRPVSVQLNCHINAPHTALGYKVAMQPKAIPFQRHLFWEAPLLADHRGKARLALVGDPSGVLTFNDPLPAAQLKRAGRKLEKLGLHRDVATFNAKVPARGSVSLRLVIPYFAVEPAVLQEALATPFVDALEEARNYWKQQFATAGRIETPEPIVNDSFDAYLYHAMLATGRKPRCGQWILKTSPNNYEGLWGAHASVAAYSMDLCGKHEWSRKVFDTFLANQGPVPVSMVKMWGQGTEKSEGFSEHPGFLGNIDHHMAILWAFYHGWTMWAIGQHTRLSNDWSWFRKHLNQLLLACDWIAEQRRRSMVNDDKGERALSWGLLPASNAFDWGFGHMFWSDAHTYRGIKEIAECLRFMGHGQAQTWLAEAEAYRQDIITSVQRCRDASAPVPMDDGSTIAFVPMSVEMRNYFVPDWTYVAAGTLNLAWAGVVEANHELIEQTLAFLEAGRPLGRWDKAAKKYQGWDWGVRAKADEDFLEATRPRRGRARFWRHRMTYEPGWIPQAFTFLARDDMSALLEHLYSLISNGGQYVHLRTPVEQRDGVAWCQPGDANVLWLLRDMLVREEDGRLILAGSCPRAWLREGQAIGVTDLPTGLGKVTYRLIRLGESIRGTCRFDFHRSPRSIRLRLRHPQGKSPRKVVADGRATGHDGGEWIDLPATCQTFEVTY